MIILLVGGSKSGKSMAAQGYAKKLENKEGILYYLATMKPSDLEDNSRIERHLLDREGFGFTTIEKDRDLKDIVYKLNNKDTILLDSITSLVTNEMFCEGNFIQNISEKIFEDIAFISKKVENLIIVTDYLFSDGIIYDNYTETFRKEIGRLNINLAKFSDIVIECSFNNEIIHKGRELVGMLK
ncbi:MULTISPECIES: bifunctional adenosylcobinamide kinase/adenosylcobinamide-phosphate guanylyltransferase [unclassified Clostridium]|uniref:bifunctional adenosylcobinamide kinase/adenosylcobinamide-phosphate guanylyltransferase n=1 Tax=unclassified Clostridium TaxID=2614128 RepID=UPI002913388E|nr:bifunctional adenosylcobinamide kinase/adenosylcobinamide-phosphate guanylyltransferase [Clostridium sp.]MDU5105610.1 bifunctional adenosylcobinamide kinase/adenosylcobinamide-phosphate guanylyltransferase [Clostridium sp.]